MLRFLSLAIVNIMILTSVKAQTDSCLTNLKDANQLTERAKYDEAITLIKNTLLKCTLSKNDKIQANKLLITNYLAIDKIEEAEAAASVIMKISPNYEPDKLRDPSEVIIIFKKYKPVVVLKGLVYGGLNLSKNTASNTFSIVTDDNSEGIDNYQSITGFQIGVGAEYRLFSSFWVQSGLSYRKSGYTIDLMNVHGKTIGYKEDLNFIDIPIAAKYYFLKGKLQPFMLAGVNLSFLNSALGQLSRDEEKDIIDRKPQRNSFYLGYSGGLGLSYSFKELSLQVGVNYLWTPQNLNKEGTRYDNLDAVFKYYYLDNDFSMNNILINIGFTYALGYKNILSKKN